jgi:DNA-binding response OmpR family regulator
MQRRPRFEMSSLCVPIQSESTVEQDLGYRESGSSVAVISKSLLLRRSIDRRLGLLGVTVCGYTHFDSLFQGSGRLQPDIILIDTADQELPWKALVSLARIFSRQSRIVLLAASMNVAQTVEAAERGVAAILIKPYRAEGHTGRILDLLLQARGIEPKRLQPRFTPNSGAKLRMDYLPVSDWPAFPMEVINISRKGAQLHLPYGEYAWELQPGRSGFPAALAVAMAQISLNLRVVYRERRSVGVVFDGPGSGSGVLDTVIHDLRSQVVEGGASRRFW